MGNDELLLRFLEILDELDQQIVVSVLGYFEERVVELDRDSARGDQVFQVLLALEAAGETEGFLLCGRFSALEASRFFFLLILGQGLDQIQGFFDVG